MQVKSLPQAQACRDARLGVAFVRGLARTHVLIALAALVVVALVAIATLQKSPAPALSYSTLKGETIAPQALQGKVYLVNFWATSCTSCVQEMPDLIKTYDRFHARGFDVIAVAMKYDPPNFVVEFAERRQLPFKVALDLKGELAKAWGDVAITPTTFLVDAQGKVVKRFVGPPDFAQLHAWLDQSLPAAPAAGA